MEFLPEMAPHFTRTPKYSLRSAIAHPHTPCQSKEKVQLQHAAFMIIIQLYPEVVPGRAKGGSFKACGSIRQRITGSIKGVVCEHPASPNWRPICFTSRNTCGEARRGIMQPAKRNLYFSERKVKVQNVHTDLLHKP